MTGLIGDHLWQSTLVAAVVWLLTLSLRSNRAEVRYWLWLAASVKFLVPFPVLMAVGSQLGWLAADATPRIEVALVIETVSQPFSRPELRLDVPASAAPMSSLPIVIIAIWACGTGLMLLTWLIRWRRVAATVRGASVVNDGRVLESLRRLEGIGGHSAPITLVSSDTSFEPGVFGILKPVLLWPQRLEEHLGEQQIEAILAHELAHVRHRDNLAAAMHMLVEAVFWFHPLVWWIGARLVDERERACDEEVIRSGSDRQVYAESVLKTCQYYIQSPLVCVSGVTGSDLKKRIELIMRSHGGEDLKFWKKLLLGSVAILTIAVPVIVGGLYAPRVRAQAQTSADLPAFEVASVKQNKSGEMGGANRMQPGGRLTITNNSLRNIIRNAYLVQDFQIVDAPDWIASERFDIVAKAAGDVPPAPLGTLGAMQLMTQRLLADRFQLAVHREMRELPLYELVLARADGRLGSQLRTAAVDCAALAAARGRGGPPPPPAPGERIQCGLRMLPGQISAGGFSLSQFSNGLAPLVQRIVVDRTGLPGSFDIDLTWTPENMGRGATPPPGAPPFPPIDPDGPSIFTALQEQLGLRLESRRGPVEVLVIDRVERPTAD